MSKQPYGGPWAVGTENGCNANTIYDCHGNSVACVYDIPIHRDVDEVRDAPGLPKAHLIASAPDLLEACRYIVEAGETGDEITAIEKARAAIAKAEGSTSTKDTTNA